MTSQCMKFACALVLPFHINVCSGVLREALVYKGGDMVKILWPSDMIQE